MVVVVVALLDIVVVVVVGVGIIVYTLLHNQFPIISDLSYCAVLARSI